MSKRAYTRLKGFSNLNYAKLGEEGPGPCKKLSDGKKIETELEYEEEELWAGDQQIEYNYDFVGGKGKLTVLGLDRIEYNDLFGNELIPGGIMINTDDKGNPISFTWERKKKNGHKRLYVLYNCICSPVGLGGAESLEKGKGDVAETEIEFSIGSIEHGGRNRIGSFIDTDDESVNKEMVKNWHTTPQFPTQDITPEALNV